MSTDPFDDIPTTNQLRDGMRKEIDRLRALNTELLTLCEREMAGMLCICKQLRTVATSDTDDTVCDRCKIEAVVNRAKGKRS